MHRLIARECFLLFRDVLDTIFTIWLEPDSGQIVESGIYRIPDIDWTLDTDVRTVKHTDN